MRYLTFICERYYPAGGMGDCIAKNHDLGFSVNQIKALLENYGEGDFHIYDTQNEKIVYEGEYEDGKIL